MSSATRIPERAWLIAALLVAGSTVGSALLQDWTALDEGTLALSARYVGAGHLPHRDFAYPYTGGLAILGALTAQVFGDSMAGARWVLFGAFMAWLWAMWAIARRHCDPPAAAVVTVLAGLWTLLMYPAALPTWYLLFLMTAMVASLLRWGDTGLAGWVWVAGVLCGLGIVLKQTGLYLLVAAGFGVLAILQSRASASGGSRPNPVVLLLLCCGFAVPLVLGVRKGLVAGDALLVAAPVVALLCLLIVRERRVGSGPAGELYAAWGRLLIGAAVFPVLLLALYGARGGAGALVDGVVTGSIRTAGFIQMEMKPIGLILAHGLPVGVVAAALLRLPPSRLQLAISLLGAAVAFSLAWTTDPGYRAVWHFATLMVPTVACAAIWTELRRDSNQVASPEIPLIVAAMVLQGLNQFPLGAPNYFGYVAPLAFLLVATIAARHGAERRLVFVALLLLAFAARFHRIGDVGTLAFGPVWRETTHALPGPHAGLFVAAEDSAAYARLLDLVGEHGGADSLVAGPELASLYALSGTRRLVRQPYLIVPDAEADSTAMAALFDTASTRSVAIQDAPLFLPRIKPDARAWLANRYPNFERVGSVEFRWR